MVPCLLNSPPIYSYTAGAPFDGLLPEMLIILDSFFTSSVTNQLSGRINYQKNSYQLSGIENP